MTVAAAGDWEEDEYGGGAWWLRRVDRGCKTELYRYNRRKTKTGEEKRNLLLRSGLIKAKIFESLNSASVPQKNSWEGPS